MPDPFRNVSANDEATIGAIVEILEARVREPQMLPIIDAYLDRLDWPDSGMVVDIGAGTGGVARRVAERYHQGRVHGIEPSPDLVAEAKRLAPDHPNLTFAVGDGADLDVADASTDAVILHTVLSHVSNPVPLLAEACRVLKHGGQVVVCDADFSKMALGVTEGDPLNACAVCFRQNFVTDPWLTAKLRPMAQAQGLEIETFEITNRLDLDGGGALAWVRMSTAFLTREGVIGDALAEALAGEYQRRAEAGSIYGFLPFATMIARKP